MSKQSANQRNKQRQGNNKSANNAAPSRPLTSVKPAQTASKANGTTATKPVEAKANGARTAKPAQIATKSGSTGTPKPAQQSANAGTLKRAQQRRQQKTQNRVAQQRDDAKSRLATILTIAVVVVLAGSLITYLVIRNNAGTDNLAQAQQIVDATYGPIDGVYCSANEQLAYHIHAHLSIYMNGQQVPLVANTGIAPNGVTSNANVECFYWLHTHDASGVIHIESPTTKLYTLSQFFDVWEQKFSSSTSPFPTELSSSTGWVIYVNGKQVNTDFNHLQLHAHDLITIAYNSPGIKPDTTYAWQGL
ncbi:MAG TPA: hypothetical protein VJO32_08445 [Ktedonobacteraceae bacterium]|nr:hypothetical protein [Ktedonobacteraceae bacterium]